jgi:hypothetical protein
MRSNKKVRYVNRASKLSEKQKLFLFAESVSLKSTSDYISMICSDKEGNNPVEILKNEIRTSLIKEFSPSILKMKSFEHIVENVMYSLQKKSLEEDESSS